MRERRVRMKKKQKHRKQLPKKIEKSQKKTGRSQKRNEAPPEHKSTKPVQGSYIRAHYLPSIHGKASPLRKLKKFCERTSVFSLFRWRKFHNLGTSIR